MRILDDIERGVRANLAAGAPPLRGTPLDRPDRAALLGGLFEPQLLTLSDPDVRLTDGGLRITGQASLFGQPPADIAIGFEALGGDCLFVIEAAAPPLAELSPLADVLAPPTLVGAIGPLVPADPDTEALPAIVRLHLRSAITTAGTSFPVTLSPPGGGNGSAWRIALDGAHVPLADAAALLQWIGLEAARLPPVLMAAGGLALTELSLALAPGRGVVAASLALARDEPWSLGSGGRIGVDRLAVTCGLEAHETSGGRTLSVTASGTLRLGDLRIPVELSAAPGEGRLRLDARPEAPIALPSLQALAEVAEVPLSKLPASVTALQSLALRGVSLEIDVARLSLVRLHAAITVAHPVPLGGGATLESVDLALTLVPGAGDEAVRAWIGARLTAGGVTTALQGVLDGELSLTGTVGSLDLGALAASWLPGLPPGLASAGLELRNVLIDVATPGRLRCEATVAADWHTLAAAIGVPMPDGLASLGLDRVAFDVDLAAGVWSVAVSASGAARFPATGDDYFQVSGSAIEVARGPGDVVTTRCDFTLSGALQFGDDLRVAVERLACSWQTGGNGGWRLDGAVEVAVAGQHYPFEAALDIEEARSRFLLRYRHAIPLVAWPGYATVQAHDLHIGLEHTAGGDRWSVAGAARFDVADGLVVADGTLQLDGASLTITAEAPAPVTIVLPLPGEPRVEIGLQPLQLRLAGASGAAVMAGASVTVHGIPAPVDRVFPGTAMSGSLEVNDRSLSLSCTPPGDLALDVVFAAGTPMEIRFPAISVETCRLERRRSPAGTERADWRLAADLRVTGLSEANRLFGSVGLFEDTVDLTLSIASGISIVCRTSPLESLPLRPPLDDGTVWTEWLTIPDLGTFSFRVPEFAFDARGGRWRASGGMERRGDLAIPVRALKALLEKAGLPTAFLHVMPDSIPLVEIDLRSAAFYDGITRTFGRGPVSDAFRHVADLLEGAVDRLPARLAEYFAFSVPERFEFDLAIEPTGGLALGVSTSGDTPLRALVPAVFGPIPELLGLTLFRLSFGLTAGGTLARVEVDGWADRTDLANLTYALVTGQGGALTNRLIARRTSALVPVGVGVPVPLFYDDIGWEYRDAFGLALQCHATFRDPEPSLTDWLALLRDLFAFFTQDDYYLHEHGCPPGMRTDFDIGPTAIALPAYLGEATLGPVGGLPPLPVTDTLARVLDGIKSGNVGWIIEAVPLKRRGPDGDTWIRVGRETVRFGPLEIGAAWCITTEREFRDEVLADGGARAALAAADSGEMLECLPSRYGGKAYDKGFVVLLMGAASASTPLARIVAFRGQFGMALTGPHDFETAVRLRGGFGPDGALELGIEGRIRVEPAGEGRPPETRIAGLVFLSVAGTRLDLSAGLAVGPDHFDTQIAASLGPGLALGGTLRVDGQGATIDGFVEWSGLGASGGRFETGAVFSADGVVFRPFDVRIGALGCRAILRLPGRAPGALFTMGVAIDLPPQVAAGFKTSLVEAADAIITDQVREAYRQIDLAVAHVHSLQMDLEGLRGWLPTLCQSIIDQITRAVSKASVERALDRWAAQEKNFIARQAREAVVSTVKATGPAGPAQDAAAPWIAKLKNVKEAAGHAADERYRDRLEAALRALLIDADIEIWTAAIKPIGFPGVRVYRMSPVLEAGHVTLVRQAIAAIDRLPEAGGALVRTQEVVRQLPERQRVLAEVRRDIASGLDAGIPAIESVGFETSIGVLDLASLTVTVVFRHGGRPIERSHTLDLTRPDRIARSLADAFAAAF
jgi:hypothetical protein